MIEISDIVARVPDSKVILVKRIVVSNIDALRRIMVHHLVTNHTPSLIVDIPLHGEIINIEQIHPDMICGKNAGDFL